jgi:uncharacterized protein YndB with AHSA1/START domain
MKQNVDKTDSMAQKHSISMTDTPFVEVTKEFNAPIEQVWQAWSDPEMIKQWWGPEGYTSPSAKTDFRIEGKYVFAMQSPNGKIMWSTGVYQEILKHQLIVCTDSFSDENGNPITPQEAGMDEQWEGADTLIFSVKFDRIDDNNTRIQLVHEGIPESEHDECVEGWTSSLNKMKRLVEKH